jgi:hypothetical protein
VDEHALDHLALGDGLRVLGDLLGDVFVDAGAAPALLSRSAGSL